MLPHLQHMGTQGVWLRSRPKHMDSNFKLGAWGTHGIRVATHRQHYAHPKTCMILAGEAVTAPAAGASQTRCCPCRPSPASAGSSSVCQLLHLASAGDLCSWCAAQLIPLNVLSMHSMNAEQMQCPIPRICGREPSMVICQHKALRKKAPYGSQPSARLTQQWAPSTTAMGSNA